MPFKSDEQRKAVMAALHATGAAVLFAGAAYLAYRGHARRVGRVANWRIASLETHGAHRMAQRMRRMHARPMKTRINLVRKPRYRVGQREVRPRQYSEYLEHLVSPSYY
jgi:hypothetical protein